VAHGTHAVDSHGRGAAVVPRAAQAFDADESFAAAATVRRRQLQPCMQRGRRRGVG